MCNKPWTSTTVSEIDLDKLKQLLLEEHSHRQKEFMMKIVTEKPELLNSLLAIIEEGDKVIAPRAAWALSGLCDTVPHLLEQNLGQLQSIFINSENTSVLRNVSRSLSLISLPKEPSGSVLDRAFDLLQNAATEVAIKVHCMTLIFNMTKIYPEIKSELKLILEDLIKTGTPGEKSRSRKLLAQLD